mmetsp:Transcript_25964/g.76105  ORF Transcript_25964/g.76105 Transcript_25964/m.76105 type:complete len:219 (-) Transcript_25964:958-1614(-)
MSACVARRLGRRRWTPPAPRSSPRQLRALPTRQRSTASANWRASRRPYLTPAPPPSGKPPCQPSRSAQRAATAGRRRAATRTASPESPVRPSQTQATRRRHARARAGRTQVAGAVARRHHAQERGRTRPQFAPPAPPRSWQTRMKVPRGSRGTWATALTRRWARPSGRMTTATSSSARGGPPFSPPASTGPSEWSWRCAARTGSRGGCRRRSSQPSCS